MNKMSQLLIRHEYAINSLQQDSTVYFFVKPGPLGLLPILFNTSEKWNKVQRESPEKTEESLRLVVLLKALLLELGQRLTNYKNNEESQQAAKEMDWIDAEGKWKTLVWNPQTEALEESPTGRTWPTESIIADTIELRKLIDQETQETVTRFQSLKGLTRAPQTTWVQLALELSVRGKGIRAWETVQSWAAGSAGKGAACPNRPAL